MGNISQQPRVLEGKLAIVTGGVRGESSGQHPDEP